MEDKTRHENQTYGYSLFCCLLMFVIDVNDAVFIVVDAAIEIDASLVGDVKAFVLLHDEFDYRQLHRLRLERLTKDIQ